MLRLVEVFSCQQQSVLFWYDDPKLAEWTANEEEAMGHYRRVRDQIRAYVETLPDALANQRG